MNLTDLEFTLARFADTALFGDTERTALKTARDIIAALRAAHNLPPKTQPRDLLSLISHKAQLPEAPQAIVQLPSSDGSQYDRYTVLPASLSLAGAIDAANCIIRQVNQEDHDNPAGGCADGDDVEGNIRRQLEALGFIFLPVERTIAWDEYTAPEPA
ncbi:MAG: hypothetical protein KGZ68_17410 [Dechloromonas sp.]|nr:hypothetical protein [Dechloromonas sp.]